VQSSLISDFTLNVIIEIMIFLGNDFNQSRFVFGLNFTKIKNKIDTKTKYTHYYLVLSLGHKRYWIGYNRLKRKIKGKLYTIDGENIFFDGKELSKQKPN